MKIFILDISGKVIKYDIALCEAIQELQNGESSISFLSPLYEEKPRCRTIKLRNLVPKKYKNGEYLWKRVIKLLEVVINYIYIIFLTARQKPDIIHFQWFPLLEVSSGEHFAVKLMRMLSKRTKMILTIHNVYPHAFSNARQVTYARRFKNIVVLMDSFIVHTEDTKREVVNDFGIEKDRVSVVHHGIFTPQNYMPNKNTIRENEMNFIVYGNLSDYKGVDIFVDAIRRLPAEYKKKVRGIIAGEMQNKVLCQKLQEESKNLNIDWYPYFLPDQELNRRIDDANVIVLPYKSISQSGVLLLALYFRRYIITSDLPTFKETLHGFTEDMFFETENSESLAQLMMKYVDGKIDTEKQLKVIEELNQQYSWEKAAVKTVELYKKVAKA